MSRKKSRQVYGLGSLLRLYARNRALEFAQYSEYHMRLHDSGFTCIDIWTSGKYWVKETNYYKMTDKPIIERGNEKGWIPETYPPLEKFLDKLFYAADMGDN